MALGKRLFIISLIIVLALLLSFQLYFFLFPENRDQARAQRLGAQLADVNEISQAVDKEESGLFLFLTFETEQGQSSEATLLLNSQPAGNFHGGVLSIKANDGDEISVIGGEKGEILYLMERPEELDSSFPDSLAIGGEEKVWGTVKLK